MKPYTYVLIREDLTPRQQMAQACHAALEAGFSFERPEDISFLIVCTVPDRAALEEASERLQRKGVTHEMFYEPDYEIGHSALATRPLFGKKERQIMARYPLFKGWGPTPEPVSRGGIYEHAE